MIAQALGVNLLDYVLWIHWEENSASSLITDMNLLGLRVSCVDKILTYQHYEVLA